MTVTERSVLTELDAPDVDWNKAPTVMESIEYVRSSPENCDLDYWYRHVAAAAADLENGHRPGVVTPDWMLEHGGFRESLLREFSFRAIAEEKAARAIGSVIPFAPNSLEMNFYATQLIDEARHAEAFKAHIGELVGRENVDATVAKYGKDGCASILEPLERHALDELRGEDAYLLGVAVLTILVEGVLAPTGELSERKWAHIDPAAASVERGASIDEVRHLAVGSEIIKTAVSQSRDAADAVAAVIARGFAFWGQLPILEEMGAREQNFQEGLEGAGVELSETLENYECWAGTLLRETTVEERITKALEWSTHAQDVRLKYMGLAGHTS